MAQQGFPNLATKIADDTGAVTTAWYRFFVQLWQLAGGSSASPISAVTPGASPYAYTATAEGHAYVDGGTGVSVDLMRQGASFTLAPVSGFFPLATGDVLTITYTTAPRLLFVPRAA